MLSAKFWRGPEMVIPVALVSVLVLAGLVSLVSPRPDPSVPSAVSVWTVMLVIQGPILLLTHWFLRRHGMGWKDGFGFGLHPRPRLWIWITGSILGSVLVLLGVNLALQQFLTHFGGRPDLQDGIRALESGPPGVQVAIAFAAIVMAPLVEEALFRGILYQWIRDAGHPRLALVLTSVTFGLVHGHLPTLLPLTLFGAYLCWLYERTGNLLACILTHAGFNAVFVVLTLIGAAGG